MTLENDINLAAIGEQWHGIARGVEDFVFMSIGTGLGAGVVLRGELQRGRHGAAGELDLVGAGREEIDPCAGAVSALAARLAAGRGRETTLAEPYDPRAVFGAARGGDAVAREVVAEEARRIALHIAPIAAVADVGLIVLGGGVGANGDLLLEPVRGPPGRVAAVRPARRGLVARRGRGAVRRAVGRPAGRAGRRAGAELRR